MAVSRLTLLHRQSGTREGEVNFCVASTPTVYLTLRLVASRWPKEPPSAIGLSVTSATGCVNFKQIASVHFCLADVSELLCRTVVSHHAVDTHLSRFPSCATKCAVNTAIRQNTRRHGF